MSNYIQGILKEKEQQDQRIQQALATLGNIPNLQNPTKQIPFIDELIIKTTYLHKIFFLAELVELFSFSYSKAQIEKIVIESEETGYIKSRVDTEYGKYFWLTRESVYYIKYNPSLITIPIQDTNINDRKIPENLFSYKCLSKKTSSDIFNLQLTELYHKFKAESKEYRTEYAKLQYIKHFMYKEFLKYPKAQKEEFLHELGFEQSDIDRYSKSKIYSNSFADSFTCQYIITKGYNSLDNLEDYQKFRNTITLYCFKAKTRNLKVLYHFLSDYHNSKLDDKKEFLKSTYTKISDMKNSYFTNGIEHVVEYLDRSDDKSIYKYQKELNRLMQTEKYLKTKKSSLIRINANKGEKLEIELQEINNNINKLEVEISAYVRTVNFISDKFNSMLYYQTKDNGIQEFAEYDITINRLASNGIYITDFIARDGFKYIVKFAIIQKNPTSIYSRVLFNKIEQIYHYWQNVLQNYELQIVIYTYNESRKTEIEETLKYVKKQFGEIRGYGIVFSLFDDIITIVDCKSKNTERFETYNFIRSEMDRLSFPLV